MSAMKELLEEYENRLIDIFQEKRGKEVGVSHYGYHVHVKYGFLKSITLSYYNYYEEEQMKTGEKYQSHVQYVEMGIQDGPYDHRTLRQIHNLSGKHARIICDHGDKIFKNLPKAIDKKEREQKEHEKETARRNAKYEKSKKICATKLEKILEQ